MTHTINQGTEWKRKATNDYKFFGTLEQERKGAAGPERERVGHVGEKVDTRDAHVFRRDAGGEGLRKGRG